MGVCPDKSRIAVPARNCGRGYSGASGAWRDRLKVLAAVLAVRLSSALANLEYLVVMGTNCA